MPRGGRTPRRIVRLLREASRVSQRVYLLVFASWAALVLIALPAPPFIYSDQASQLKPLLQYLGGESPSFNHFVTANPTNLREVVAEWDVYWPATSLLLVWPFVAAGVSLGHTLFALAAAALLIGSVGWIKWWMRFDVPSRILLAAAVLMPWRRYSSNALFQSSAEVLAFAAAPWVFLATHALMARVDAKNYPGRFRALLWGLGAGALYCVKYSAVFVSAGVSAALLLRHWRDRRAWSRVLVPAFAGVAIPIAALSLVNRALGGAANFVTMSEGSLFSPQLLLYAVSNPALITGDAAAMLDFVLTNPAHGIWRAPFAVVAFGIPGGLTLAWLATKASTLAERIAVVVLLVTVVLLTVTWVATPQRFYEARHMAPAGTAIVPAMIAIARRHWKSFRPIMCVWLVAAGMFYIAVPWALYGPASVVAKVRRTAGYRATESGVYNPVLSATDPRRALRGLEAACEPAGAVWYVPEPLTALDMRGPMIITHADFESIRELVDRRYEGAVPVCALLPPRFEQNGKGPLIRATFVDVASWRRVTVAESAYDLWLGLPAAQR